MRENELFGSTAWSEVLRRAYGFETRKTPGGLPFVALDDLAGKRVASLPFSDYLPTTEGDWLAAQLHYLKEAYPDQAVTVKTTLGEDRLPPGVAVSRRAVYHRYHPGGATSAEFRRGVRRATKRGVRILRSTDEAALDRFQELYHWQRLRKFGGIPQPPSFFRAVREVFLDTGRGFVLEALTEAGHVAASVVVLREGDGWFYKFGASDPAHLNDRPNNAIFSHLTSAVDAGEAVFLDLGLSGVGESYAGLRRFKSGTGSTGHPVSYVRWPGGGPVDPSVQEFKAFLQGFTKSAVAADRGRAEIAPISESLYRYFA